MRFCLIFIGRYFVYGPLRSGIVLRVNNVELFRAEIAGVHAWGRKIAVLHDGNFRCRLSLDWTVSGRMRHRCQALRALLKHLNTYVRPTVWLVSYSFHVCFSAFSSCIKNCGAAEQQRRDESSTPRNHRLCGY